MYDRTEFLNTIRSVHTSTGLLCSSFQQSLSGLLDGEIGEGHARKSLSHLEHCSHCSEFFQAIRLQALAHSDLAVPGSLTKRLRRMRGSDMFEGLTDKEVVRRMASALYELGKAYVLLANDDSYRLQVSELPVEIDQSRLSEAADLAEAAEAVGADHLGADLFEGRGEDFLDKGRRLLNEALSLKPKFAEARLYSGFLHQLMEDFEKAAADYREVFLCTDRQVNRSHAAIQLGQLYDHLELHSEALRMYRWVLASGLVARKPEFSFVLFNIAIEHLALGDVPAACAMLGRIRMSHPDLWSQVKDLLHQSPDLLSQIGENEDFRRQIEDDEPNFFAA